MIKTSVLIIGAGPTGLMAASQLRRYGVDVTIIDKKTGPTKESRALVLHARSLEIYEQMGIVEEALKGGEIIQKVQFLVKRKKVQDLPLGKLGEGLSPFPFLLIFEQSKNEDLLYSYFKENESDVLWNTEMISIKANPKSEDSEKNSKIIATVKTKNEKQTIEAEYVIAADGAKSTVRDALNIQFKGDSYEHIFYVADTSLDWKWGHEHLSIYLFNQSFLGLIPMKGKNRFRAIGILPVSYQNEHPNSFEEIVPHIEKQVNFPLNFSDTTWFSVYRLHHRCMETFRYGNVFFVGDAAHIHSPAGGQGMNTGLQDAYNLAWKLGLFVNGFANEDLLNTYEQERLPVAQKLIASTDRAFAIVTSTKWYNRFLRMRFLPLISSILLKFKRVRLRSFRNVSQIGIRYISSDLTVNRVKKPLAVKAGERLPYLVLNNNKSLYELLKDPLFHVLVFATTKETNSNTDVTELENDFRKGVKVIDLSKEEKIMKQLKINDLTVIVVRPDNYIGLITDEGIKVVRDYLKKIQSGIGTGTTQSILETLQTPDKS